MKQNYQRKMEEEIQKLSPGEKPRLLLHSCCGPCSTQVLRVLAPHFELALFYYNPNIHPKEEYIHRFDEQKRLLQEIKEEIPVELIRAPYHPKTYFETVKGLEDLGEGSFRCEECFSLRLKETAKKAKELGYDYFTTTLSISPHKDAQALNRLGEEIGNEIGVRYLYGDFKKKDGYKKSIAYSKLYDLYRQEYCGCIFSRKEMTEKR